MDPEDLQLVEFAIAEPIRLPFHGLDLGVGSLQRPGGDGVVMVGENAFLVLLNGVGKLKEDADAGGAGTSQPIAQDPTRGSLVRLGPNLPQIVLEVIGRSQRQVECEGSLKALAFMAVFVEVLRVL